MGVRPALPPVQIDRVLDAPERVRELVERHAPYAPVQRYFRNEAQMRAGGSPPIVAPNFRGDWAYDEPLVDGVGFLLEHPGFIAAAQQVFGAAVVQPQQVYMNLTWQLPFPQGPGHTDVPAFRGVDRTTIPTPVLQVMGASGLFERWRVEIATAVSWWYQGGDGGFEYWPEGPDQPARVHEGAIFNTAIVGDNDFMFHRVRPVGAASGGLPRGLSLDSRVSWLGGDRWQIRDGETVIGEPGWDELRISVSWKANVFREPAAVRLYRDHSDDLDIDRVFELFAADLEGRGVSAARSEQPLDDPEFYAVLAETYPIALPPAID